MSQNKGSGAMVPVDERAAEPAVTAVTAQTIQTARTAQTAQTAHTAVTVGHGSGDNSASTTRDITAEILARRAHEPGALLPILHELQDRLGWVPKEAVPQIAEALNLSRAEVHGVVTYYHHFRSSKPGRHVVQVCRAEACQARGANALLAHAESLLGCKSHHTRADGAVTLDPVYCLGLCAMSPAVMVDEQLYGRMTPQRLAQIAAGLELTA